MTTGDPAGSGCFIWATRGRTWGFRFLRDCGFDDPLEVYQDAFAGFGDRREGWQRLDAGVVLRFPDPEGRRDAAGRKIPHDLVLFDRWADGVDSLEAGIRRIWPEISDEFARVWHDDLPPAPRH